MSELQKLKDENKKLLEKITDLENEIHKSAYYKEGSYAIEAVERGQIIAKQEKEIQKLKDEFKKLKHVYALELVKKNKEIEIRDKEIQKLKDNKGIHNERGAGRKSKLKDHDKEVIKMYRLQGKTIKEIAELYNCSVGLIHKIISEKN